MLSAPLTSAFSNFPVEVLYNPLLILFPENTYSLSSPLVNEGTSSLSKNDALDV